MTVHYCDICRCEVLNGIRVRLRKGQADYTAELCETDYKRLLNLLPEFSKQIEEVNRKAEERRKRVG